jgi:hypothetical protein
VQVLGPIVFIRWHELVANSLFQIWQRSGEKLLHVPYPSPNKLDEVSSYGIYGIYDGIFFGIFKVFEDESETLNLCIGEKIYKISFKTEMTHDINTLNRIFKISLIDGHTVSFKYRKILWNLFHKSKAKKIDYFFDDWWGIECDLPSWVYSTFRAEGITGVSSKIEEYASKVLGEDLKNLTDLHKKI